MYTADSILCESFTELDVLTRVRAGAQPRYARLIEGGNAQALFFGGAALILSANLSNPARRRRDRVARRFEHLLRRAELNQPSHTVRDPEYTAVVGDAPGPGRDYGSR